MTGVGSRGVRLAALLACLPLAACGSSTPSTTSTASPTQVSSPTPRHTSTPSTRPSSGCPFPSTSPITAAPGVGKTVALTFDDGASIYTPQILAVLARFRVHATFFDTGLADTRYPQYARAVVAAGDVLGNHTYDHPKNWGFRTHFTLPEQRLELTRASQVQTPQIGHAPCVMRPPGGAYDATSLALVRGLGMSLVMWSTSGEDWQQPPYLSTTFQQAILRRAESGAALAHPIILLHAGKASHEPDCSPSACASGQVSSFRGNTVAVLPALIRFYLARGYRFVVLR